jgi:hypothetical protein
MTRGTYVLALSTCLFACSADGLHNAPEEEPLDPNVARRALEVRTLCAAYITYATLETYTQFPNGPFCTQHPIFTAEDFGDAVLDLVCSPGWPGYVWADSLLEAAEAGRVAIDRDLVQACITQAREVKARVPAVDLPTHADWLAVQAGPCRDFYRGTVADGEACLDDWDCAADASGCFTDTPFQSGTLRCAPAGQLDEPCSDWHGCAKDMYCSLGTCRSSLFGQPAGGACSYYWNCSDPCARCVITDGAGVCDRRGGLGDACTLTSECATDLGCIDGVCNWAAVGAACDILTIPCEFPALCASGCWEHDNRQAACEGTGACTYTFDTFANYGFCDPIPGGTLDYRCEAIPGAGEPCLFGLCDTGYYCQAGYCQNLAGVGMPCSPSGNSAPLCWNFLVCGDTGVCVAPCQLDADCGASEWCNLAAAPPVCVAVDPGNCTTSNQCADDQFCTNCAYFAGQQDCLNTVGCAWTSSGHCANFCGDYNGNAVACGTHPECRFQTGTSVCASVCATLSANPDACDADDLCNFVESFSMCEPTVSCWSLLEADGCNADPTCVWNTDFEWCDDRCPTYQDVDSCRANTGCEWNSTACESICESGGPLDEEACGTHAASCSWNRYGACRDAVQCSTAGADGNACRALDNCSFVDSGECASAGPTATFSCQARRAVGEQCSGDEMCLSNTCADNEGAMVCAETSWIDRATNVGWLVRLILAMGGVLILRRRIRS